MHPALQTPLLDLLGCRYPIVQTGMGWVAGPKLVSATCNAGAFGIERAETGEGSRRILPIERQLRPNRRQPKRLHLCVQRKAFVQVLR